MAREVSHQSVGNPLQYERLPKRRPELAMRYLPYAPTDDSQYAMGWTMSGVALGMAAMVVKFLAVFAEGPFYFVFVNLIPVVIALYLVVRACQDSDARWLHGPMGFLVAATVYLNLPLPQFIHDIVASIALGRLTWLFATHWTAFCTASPFEKTAAGKLHNSWQGYIVGVATVPGALLLLFRHLPVLAVMIGLAVILFQLLAAIMTRPNSHALTVGWRAIVSWLSYDRHDALPPGALKSPAGVSMQRLLATAASIIALSVIPIDRLIPIKIHDTLQANGSPFAPEVTLIQSSLPFLPFLVVFPALVTFAIPVVLTLPLLSDAESRRTGRVTSNNWQQLVDEIQHSVDPIERSSVFMGRVVADATPLLVPRGVYAEHGHFLGDSGGGKTSLGLCPLMEQLGLSGDCSIIVLDLKADTLELLGTLQAIAEQVQKRSGQAIPVKHFTNQVGRSTFAFNLLDYPFWSNLELFMRTDILCGALGLTYGADYGEGYYSSANAAVLHHTIKTFPDVKTYGELGERMGYVAANAKKTELHPEIRKAGVHVKTVLDRLGAFSALNAASHNGSPDEVLREAIDFTRVFQEPQFHYFHLSATLAPGSSPEIARLVTYSLLAAATQVERKRQVFLVIDEFQRMVARNIEYMLQLARSMGVGVILANQTMQDLRTSTADLIPPIEANCRYRQWFAVSSEEDRDRLIKSSGETVDHLLTETTTHSANGVSQSVSFSEQINNRLTVNDVLLASDHPRRSIVRISRGAGYAQYGGMPFVVESDYHISEEEYQKRKNTPWPDGGNGAFVPSLVIPSQQATQQPPSPVIATEVIGGPKASSSDITDPLAQFVPPKSKRRQSKKESS